MDSIGETISFIKTEFEIIEELGESNRPRMISRVLPGSISSEVESSDAMGRFTAERVMGVRIWLKAAAAVATATATNQIV